MTEGAAVTEGAVLPEGGGAACGVRVLLVALLALLVRVLAAGERVDRGDGAARGRTALCEG